MMQNTFDDTDRHEDIRITVKGIVSKSRLLAVNVENNFYDNYTVTHLPTGYVVAYFPTRESALRAMEELDALGCWEFDQPDGAKAHSAKVHKIYDRHWKEHSERNDPHD